MPRPDFFKTERDFFKFVTWGVPVQSKIFSGGPWMGLPEKPIKKSLKRTVHHEEATA